MKFNNLQTKFLGQNTIYFEEIDSTQHQIWKMYENDAPNGTLVIANSQTNGQGTHGRSWFTLKNNITFSFLIKPDCTINKLDGLTLDIAKIIVQIFKSKYNIELSIKKPNDIVYNGKKLGGILTQTKLNKEKVKALVIGIGINTSLVEFPDELKDIATSIKNEFNIDVDVKEFIKEFCIIFEKNILERIEKQ